MSADAATLSKALGLLLASIRRNAPPALATAIIADARLARVASAAGGESWPPPVPEGPLVVLFLSPPAARSVAATLGEHSTYPNIVGHLREYAERLEPGGEPSAGQWWIVHTPVPEAWREAIR